ncbi:hypothetical protein SUGI_0518850 [Cryptomeria japonica]|nr:hypothetical protein SUGI_0518850 [Cryptomeria japonica]
MRPTPKTPAFLPGLWTTYARIASGQDILLENAQMPQCAIIVVFLGMLHLSALQSPSVGIAESLGITQFIALMIQYATLVAKWVTLLETAHLQSSHLEK